MLKKFKKLVFTTIVFTFMIIPFFINVALAREPVTVGPGEIADYTITLNDFNANTYCDNCTEDYYWTYKPINCNTYSEQAHWNRIVYYRNKGYVKRTEGTLDPLVSYARYVMELKGDLETADNEIYSEQHKALQNVYYLAEVAPFQFSTGAAKDYSYSVVEKGQYFDYNHYAYQRALSYAKAWYGILNEAANDYNGQLFNITGAGKIFVDQPVEGEGSGGDVYGEYTPALGYNPDGTYTVGPFRMNTIVECSYECKLALYEELSKKAFTGEITEDMAFAEFLGISNIETAEDTEPWFVNSSGTRIEFPNFADGEKFYIRFYPANSGAIINIKPEIDIQYLNTWDGETQKEICTGFARWNWWVGKISVGAQRQGFARLTAKYDATIESYDGVETFAKRNGASYYPDGIWEEGVRIAGPGWYVAVGYKSTDTKSENWDKKGFKLDCTAIRVHLGDFQIESYSQKRNMYGSYTADFNPDEDEPEQKATVMDFSIVVRPRYSNDIGNGLSESEFVWQRDPTRRYDFSTTYSVDEDQDGIDDYDQETYYWSMSSIWYEFREQAVTNDDNGNDGSNKTWKNTALQLNNNHAREIRRNIVVKMNDGAKSLYKDGTEQQIRGVVLDIDDGSSSGVISLNENDFAKALDIVQSRRVAQLQEPNEQINDSKDSHGQGEAEIEGKANWKWSKQLVPKKFINMQIQGRVFWDGPSLKAAAMDGIYHEGEDFPATGVQVQLYRSTDGTVDSGELVATTLTDKNGKYWFYGKVGDKPLINPMWRYFVVFTYNGQIYQASEYYESMKDGDDEIRSNAKETENSNAIEIGRETLNNTFANINPFDYNYNGSNNAFPYNAIIRDSDGNYVSGEGYSSDEYDGGSFTSGNVTYGDVWRAFKKHMADKAMSIEEVRDPQYDDYKLPWNRELSYDFGVMNAGSMSGQVQQYAKDCLVTAKTQIVYPVENNYIIEYYDKESGGFSGTTTVRDLSGLTADDYEDVDISVLIKELVDNPDLDDLIEKMKNLGYDGGGYSLPSTWTTGTKTVKRVKPEALANCPTIEVEWISEFIEKEYKYINIAQSAQFYHLDFAMQERVVADLALQKDLYKVSMVVNGRDFTYDYNKKSGDLLVNSATFQGQVSGLPYVQYVAADGYYFPRIGDSNYNGTATYNRKLRSSEYLFKAETLGDDPIKDLRIYVTYRVAVKNQGGVNTTVNEIVDYYDANEYSWHIDRPKYDEQYVGAGFNGERGSGDLVRSDSSVYNTKTNDVGGLSRLYLRILQGGSPVTLAPGELTYAYYTFEVNRNEYGKRINIDNPKRNIAEINAYSTTYASGTSVPNFGDVSGKVAGLVDMDSTPGNLASGDFNGTEAIITKLEDDTDRARNFIIEIDNEKVRQFNGYVFEDERNVKSASSGQSQIGDGNYNGETLVNGVKVELVELIQQVDGNGLFTSNYLGERIWGTYEYYTSGDGGIKSTDFSRYWSGKNVQKIIITSDNAKFNVTPRTFEENKGQYGFTSIPAGVFFVRFTYGDHVQNTLLTDEAAEENTKKLSATTDYSQPLESVNSIVGKAGLNAKSYNGQDYKSTVYQPGLSQATNYRGVSGYQNYDTQNYTNAAGKINNGTDKTSMYYYDISEGNKSAVVNDAKDVEARRLEVNDYSSGVNNDLAGGQSVLNYRAEVLDSWERVASNADGASALEKKAKQTALLSEFMTNTSMIAQTGIINLEVEEEKTEMDGTSDDTFYEINNLLLGLQERPRSQLIISKKVANFKLVLANNQVLFDANQAVNDLIYTPHEEHQPEEPAYTANKRLSGVILAHKKKLTPELVQAALDDELMEGSRVDVTYKFTVRNTSEVDYVDKKFYYTGIEDHPAINIVKTAANGVIDYVSNMIKYDRNYQEDNTEWTLRAPEYLIGSLTGTDVNLDYVNSKYYDLVKDYNAILTTNKLGTELVPEKFEYSSGDPTSVDTTLILSTLISVNNGANNLVYNNLTEIISYTNSVGRRMQYSVVGNQPMADQTERTDLPEDYVTLLTRVTPEEVDADSAQRIVLMPPTGENKDYIPVIAAIVAALGIVGVAIFEIRKLLKR